MKKTFQQRIRKSIQANDAVAAAHLCRAQPDVDEAAREAILEAIRLDQDAIIDVLLPLLTASWKQEPLKTAAKLGKVDLVRMLMPYCDSEDDAALCLAARHGHLECVQLLIRSCNPFQRDSQALYEASLHGHSDVVFHLILGSDAKARNSRALIAACREGHLEVVKHLLPFSSKIQCAQYGFSAAAENNHVEVIDYLIGAGLPDPEDTYSMGLNVAAAKGHESLVRKLLWAIVKTGHAPRDFGYKAMLAAATIGHAEIVKSLLEFAHKTADPELGLYIALQNCHDEVVDVLVPRANLDLVRELIPDKETFAKLDESIAKAAALKERRELDSNEYGRAREQAKVSTPAIRQMTRPPRL